MPIRLRNPFLLRSYTTFAALILLLSVIFLTGCGETYRQSLTPIIPPGGDPQATHYAVAISKNGGADGAGMLAQINVPGDVNMGNRQVGVDPVHASFAPVQSRVWIVNRGGDSVTAYVPTVLSAPSATLSLEPNSGASFVASTLNQAFVAESNLDKVAMIDANQTVAVAFVPVGDNPVSIAATQALAKIYVANRNDSTVSVISTSLLQTTGTPIPVGSGPVATAIQTSGAYVYVASDAGNSISVIDTNSDTEIQRVTGLSAPSQLVWDNGLKRLYVVNSGSNTVSIFNASAPQLTLLRTVNLSGAPLGIAVLDDGSKFYVLRGGSPGQVDVYDAQSFLLRTTITVQNDPVSIAASPGSTKVYVANRAGDPNTASLANGSISIIKTLDESVINIAPAGPNPFTVLAQ
ncbi:MAG TPA: YncE family protein [Terriglobales bacterium]|nr:YncE family protein [Terriglobales bacterium]